MSTNVREQVRERYAEAATSIATGRGCGCDCDSLGCCGDEATTLFGQGLYEQDERASLPETAVTASLGCGNPLAMVELHTGEYANASGEAVRGQLLRLADLEHLGGVVDLAIADLRDVEETLEVVLELGIAWNARKGWGAPEAIAPLERASHLIVVSHSTARDVRSVLASRVPPMTPTWPATWPQCWSASSTPSRSLPSAPAPTPG